MLKAPIQYSSALEEPKPSEDATIKKLNGHFREIMDTTLKDNGHAIRGVHAKSHGVLKGTLTVKENLQSDLAQGMFATPGEHEVTLRMSTNAGDILHDRIPLPRGLAMKVHDVDGERLPDAEGRTQDFIFLNAPAFPAPDADAFESNLAMLAKTTDRVEWLKKVAAETLGAINSAREAVGLGSSPALASLGGVPNLQPLGETYYSATAFRFGDHVAKFRLVPTAEWMIALEGEEVNVAGRHDGIREEVRIQMQSNAAQWAMQVQLLRDLDAQPIEDASVEWSEDVSPFTTVASIDAPVQDAWLPTKVDEVNEHLRFSVWTGLEAHRPLGNINRARKETYAQSSSYRERANGCPIHEPG